MCPFKQVDTFTPAPRPRRPSLFVYDIVTCRLCKKAWKNIITTAKHQVYQITVQLFIFSSMLPKCLISGH